MLEEEAPALALVGLQHLHRAAAGLELPPQPVHAPPYPAEDQLAGVALGQPGLPGQVYAPCGPCGAGPGSSDELPEGLAERGEGLECGEDHVLGGEGGPQHGLQCGQQGQAAVQGQAPQLDCEEEVGQSGEVAAGWGAQVGDVLHCLCVLPAAPELAEGAQGGQALGEGCPGLRGLGHQPLQQVSA
eukprot:CAMPEP_0173310642 /NCGR_PEP_ID=MMETSP1143-20121109/23042_1 /TAXON_ID=483371 /ORGANISM="non described non described, Strain CCMP2298" /LENGTH=185 /DNA_ID=CAMNT_0014252453 /DNA_START=25 /DNA_END=579 /DNA_ORIENTATION=+